MNVQTILTCCCAMLLCTTGADAQQRDSANAQGAIRGEVIDAETGRGIDNALVQLFRARADLAFGVTTASPLQVLRSTRSDSIGGYRFLNLAGGSYDVRVSRIGYRSAVIGVELADRFDARVSIGLRVIPIVLVPVASNAGTPIPYARTEVDTDREGAARVEAAHSRQRTLLSSDARELTHADVLEAITLAETDVFRSFQRLPGVSARDQYSAELWIRGSRWDNTRVYFDEIPLLHPLHAAGGFSGVNPDAIGSALLHPGVRPTSLGEGGAAVIELHSRAGDINRRFGGVGELSVASTRVAVDGSTPDGTTAWMVAARRSYLDWLTGAISRVAGDESIRVPYGFGGLTARVDRSLPNSRALEVSGIVEQDYLTGDIPDFRHGNRASWGNAGVRATVVSPIGRWGSRHTALVSRFNTNVRVVDIDPGSAGFNAASEPPLSAGVMNASFGGRVERLSVAGRWTIGYGVNMLRTSFDGAATYLVAGSLDENVVTRANEMTYGTAWFERRQRSNRVEIDAGLRVDAGPRIMGSGALRASPRIQLRRHVDSLTVVSVGAGRSVQYVQTTWRPDRLLYWQLLPVRLWLVAGKDVPALQTDQVNTGMERWITATTLLAVNAYFRMSNRMTMPDPTPGVLIDRPLFVLGKERSTGLELSARKLAGTVTGSGSISYNRTATAVGSLEFDSPNARRLVFDASARARIGNNTRIGATFVAASGARFARLREGVARINEDNSSSWLEEPVLGAPSAQINSPFSSLDLVIERGFSMRGVRMTVFGQVQNALGRRQAASLYTGFEPSGNGCNVADIDACSGRDAFVRGMPRLPLIGVRAVF